jgi:LSD1 subclass zinc finger protein
MSAVNDTATAQINCGNCRIMLMYPYGAPSVKCAVCHYITNIGVCCSIFVNVCVFNLFF